MNIEITNKILVLFNELGTLHKQSLAMDNTDHPFNEAQKRAVASCCNDFMAFTVASGYPVETVQEGGKEYYLMHNDNLTIKCAKNLIDGKISSAYNKKDIPIHSSAAKPKAEPAVAKAVEKEPVKEPEPVRTVEYTSAEKQEPVKKDIEPTVAKVPVEKNQESKPEEKTASEPAKGMPTSPKSILAGKAEEPAKEEPSKKEDNAPKHTYNEFMDDEVEVPLFRNRKIETAGQERASEPEQSSADKQKVTYVPSKAKEEEKPKREPVPVTPPVQEEVKAPEVEKSRFIKKAEKALAHGNFRLTLLANSQNPEMADKLKGTPPLTLMSMRLDGIAPRAFLYGLRRGNDLIEVRASQEFDSAGDLHFSVPNDPIFENGLTLRFFQYLGNLNKGMSSGLPVIDPGGKVLITASEFLKQSTPNTKEVLETYKIKEDDKAKIYLLPICNTKDTDTPTMVLLYIPKTNDLKASVFPVDSGEEVHWNGRWNGRITARLTNKVFEYSVEDL